VTLLNRQVTFVLATAVHKNGSKTKPTV